MKYVWNTGSWGTSERPGPGRGGMHTCQSAEPSQPGLSARSFEGFIMIYPMQTRPFLQVTFIAFGKSSHGQHKGRTGFEANRLNCRERTWTWNISNWQRPGSRQPSPGQTLGEGKSLVTTTATARAPAPGCKQLLTLSPNRGSFWGSFPDI